LACPTLEDFIETAQEFTRPSTNLLGFQLFKFHSARNDSSSDYV